MQRLTPDGETRVPSPAAIAARLQTMFTNRTVAATLALLAIAAAAWWLWGRGITVATVLPQRGSAAEVVYATGNVEPLNWAKVTALQRKRIVDLCRCEGAAVRKGEVLARLDDLEERAVLTELEARLQRLHEDVARLATLLERNAISRTSFEEKQTQAREYEARVVAQKERLSDLELKSPMDGIVLRRDGEVGEIAGTGVNDVLLWIGQPKPLRVAAEVDEDDIRKVAVGQKVLLRHEAGTGQPLTATVDSLTPKGDPQTKTFRVYLALPDDTPLKIGMSVEANIIVREVADGMLVPSEAVGGGTVLVVTHGRVTRRTVETGIRGTRMIEIRKGIGPGEPIVTPFRADLRDGTRIHAMPAPATP